MINEACINSASGAAAISEQGRIEFLLQRDGLEATITWVGRTLRIYRRAVLNKRHFASTPAYRQKFVEAYCDFKRWLAENQVSAHDCCWDAPVTTT